MSLDPAFAERNCHRQLHPWRDTNHDGGVDDVSCPNLVAQEGFAPNSRSFYAKAKIVAETYLLSLRTASVAASISQRTFARLF
jgi:hypothetical protein